MMAISMSFTLAPNFPERISSCVVIAITVSWWLRITEHYHGTSLALENSGHNVCFNLFAMVNEWRLLHSCAVADVRLGLVMSMMPPMGYRQALWGSRFWHPPTLLGRSCLWAAFKYLATFLLTNTVLQNDPVVGCRNSQPSHHERRMDPPQQ